MLEMLTSTWPDFNPNAISMDSEKALMNTFGAKFPDADIHGCFFHLAQNIEKKIVCGVL